MNVETENRDFKYVLQDPSRIYIGARYSYQEMMEAEDVPFKWKAILSHYILKEVAGDTTPENHIFYMKDTDLSYMVYRQMKIKFKLHVPVLSRKSVWQYQSTYHTSEEIVGGEKWQADKDRIVVEEMVIGKLQMMLMSL